LSESLCQAGALWLIWDTDVSCAIGVWGWLADLAVEVTASTCLGLCKCLPPLQKGETPLCQPKNDIYSPDYDDLEDRDHAIACGILFKVSGN
jgi:hypothetical protein